MHITCEFGESIEYKNKNKIEVNSGCKIIIWLAGWLAGWLVYPAVFEYHITYKIVKIHILINECDEISIEFIVIRA